MTKQQVKLYLREDTIQALEPLKQTRDRSQFIERAIWKLLQHEYEDEPKTAPNTMTPPEEVEFYERKLKQARAKLKTNTVVEEKHEREEELARKRLKQAHRAMTEYPGAVSQALRGLANDTSLSPDRLQELREEVVNA